MFSKGLLGDCWRREEYSTIWFRQVKMQRKLKIRFDKDIKVFDKL